MADGNRRFSQLSAAGSSASSASGQLSGSVPSESDGGACSAAAILDAQNLNLIAVSFAGALAAKLTDNERAVLSLFFATVSTALANIAFVDDLYSKRAEAAASEAAAAASDAEAFGV